MKKNASNVNNRKTDRAFRLLCFGAVGLGVLIGMVILFWYKPKTYQPLRPDNPEQVSLYLTHELGPDYFNQVQLDKPFDLIIEQSGLNDIISRLDWPQEIGEMTFADPSVIFSDQSILLMGTLEYKGVSSVLSIQAYPTIDSDKQICLNIKSIRLGMIPVTTLMTKLCQKAFDDNRDSFTEDPDIEKIVQSIIHNEPFDPVFQISDQRARITHFTIEQGILKLTLLAEKT